MSKFLWIMVDVEADGPAPGLYSMTEFGAVVVEPGLARSYHGCLKPISETFNLDALKVSGRTREETLCFDEPKTVMQSFHDWLHSLCKEADVRFMFVSDNNGFDWQYINYYFWRFLGKNPFGHSSTNLGSLYKGFAQNMRVNFKHLRKTKHTHHPVADAMGNAEAFLALKEQGLKD